MEPGHVFPINSKLSAACWCCLHEVVLTRPLTSPPLQNEGKEPCFPTQHPHSQGSGYRPGMEADPSAVLREIPGRESALSEISTGLAVVFQRNCTGSSTRQKAHAANGEQKHHGKSCSLHCRERFTILLLLSQEDWAIQRISSCGFTIRKLMQLKTKLHFLLGQVPDLKGMRHSISTGTRGRPFVITAY